MADEKVAQLVRCIRLNLDCADVCDTTGRVLSRLTEVDADLQRSLLEVCAEACRVCAKECERHAQLGMQHCRVCAEACRRCEEACRSLIGPSQPEPWSSRPWHINGEADNAAIDLVDTDPAFLGSIERLDVLDHQTGDVLARPDPFRDPDLEVEHENKQRGKSKKDN